MSFCLKCGQELVIRRLENRDREVCPACDWIYYPQLKVSGGALITHQGEILLVCRANEPWKGYWYLPAGYSEVDEAPAITAERETLEETGLVVRAGSLVGTYYFSDDPRGNGLLVVYRCEWLDGGIRPTDESLETRFFKPENLPQKIAGAGHGAALRDWLAEIKMGRT
jgi:ADP-ribose pyrophosphatase YjhB (NUDIX family)